MKDNGPSGNRAVGDSGEALALSYLQKKKFVILETNYRCKAGEVDIIARDGKVLVFVEVKTRKTVVYGPPQLAVTPFKQRQISKAALTFLSQKRMTDAEARFDVIAITLSADKPAFIEHIRNAFDLSY